MAGTIALLSSKRGVYCLIVTALSYVLVLTGHLTGPDWADFIKWITGFLVAGHTASSLADRFKPPALPVAVALPTKPTPPAS